MQARTMQTKDMTPRICWKSVAVVIALIVALLGMMLFAHYHLATDNHPSTQPLVPKSSRKLGWVPIRPGVLSIYC